MRVACICSSKHDYVYNISIKQDAKSLHSVLVGLEVWWYPELGWTVWTRMKSLLPIGIETIFGSPARKLDTTLPTILRLPNLLQSTQQIEERSYKYYFVSHV